MCILSDKEHVSVIHHPLLFMSSFFIRVVNFEIHGRFLYGRCDNKHPNDCKYKFYWHKKRLHPPILILRRSFDQVIFGKQVMPRSSCDGGFHLDQNNCRWNHFHVPCPISVVWISFLIVEIDRAHLLCKYPNGDVSPFDCRFWSPNNTHHLILILQVMP